MRSLEAVRRGRTVRWMAMLLVVALGNWACEDEQSPSDDVVPQGDVQEDTHNSDLQTEDHQASDATPDSQDVLPGDSTPDMSDVEPDTVEATTLTVTLDSDVELPDPHSIQVYLFEQEDGNPSCVGIDPRNPPLPAEKSAAAESTDQPVVFSSFVDITQENPSTIYTVLAVAADQGGTLLAVGCNDTDALMEYGTSTSVQIALNAPVPSYAGLYAMEIDWGLLDALPSELQAYLGMFLDYLTGPAGGTLRLACTLTDNASQALCDLLFQDPENPSTASMTPYGELVLGILDGHLAELTSTGSILSLANSVTGTLDKARFGLNLDLQQEPDATGFLSSDHTALTWTSLTIRWELQTGCEGTEDGCWKVIPAEVFDQAVAEAHPEIVIPGYGDGVYHAADIHTFALDFHWGAFFLHIVENEMLPAVAGDGSDGLPKVDSLHHFLNALLGGKECLAVDDCCQRLADEMTQLTDVSFPANILEEGCHALVTLGSPTLEGYLLSLDEGPVAGPSFQTPTDDSCALFDNDSDGVIDAWGQESSEEACHLQVTLSYQDQPATTSTADFRAVRVTE